MSPSQTPSPHNLPDSAFTGSAANFFEGINPDYRVTTCLMTLKLLSALRMESMDNGNMLSALAHLEARISPIMASLTITPKIRTTYE